MTTKSEWKEQQRALSFRLDEIVTGTARLTDTDRAVIDLASSVVLNHATDQVVKSEWQHNTAVYWKDE